jgi:hypothetical protein
VLTQDTTIASLAINAVATASATCSDGKLPLGGGFEPTPGTSSAVFLNLVSSGPSGNGWTVNLRNNTGPTRTNVGLRVWVVCSSQP